MRPKTLDEKTHFRLEHNYVHSQSLAAGVAIENDPTSNLRMKVSFSGMAAPDPGVLTCYGKFTSGGHIRTLVAFKPTERVSLVHVGNFNMRRWHLREVDMGVGIIFEA